MERKTVNINSYDMPVKEYNGQRVVTFKDIDAAHERPEGTARRNFNYNKHRYTEGKDYFKVSVDEIRMDNIIDISNKASGYLYFFTQSGCSMLLKSFRDYLAWDVQGEFINPYFNS